MSAKLRTTLNNGGIVVKKWQGLQTHSLETCLHTLHLTSNITNRQHLNVLPIYSLQMGAHKIYSGLVLCMKSLEISRIHKSGPLWTLLAKPISPQELFWKDRYRNGHIPVWNKKLKKAFLGILEREAFSFLWVDPGSILHSSLGHCKVRTQGLKLPELAHCQLKGKTSLAGERRDKRSADKIRSFWINPTVATYFCFSVICEPINVFFNLNHFWRWVFCVTGISKGNVNEVETKGMGSGLEEANLRQ